MEAIKALLISNMNYTMDITAEDLFSMKRVSASELFVVHVLLLSLAICMICGIVCLGKIL
jgi:hypothetical protein